MPDPKVVPLRGIRPIPARDLEAIYTPRPDLRAELVESLKREGVEYRGRVNLYDAMRPQPTQGDYVFGFLDAVADFIADPRFIAGFFVGTLGLCAAAFVVAF